MAASPTAKLFAGARIRALREQLGLSQVEMARRLDLSISYINQLENDNRPLTVPVLLRLTSTFAVDATYFSGDADARLLTDVRAALAGTDTEPAVSAELVARFPQVARHIIRLTRRHEEDATLLSKVTQTPGAGASDRALFAYERVRDYFYSRRNHIARLDHAAEAVAARIGVAEIPAESAAAALAGYLEAEHGVHTVVAEAHAGAPRRRFARATRTLVLSSQLTAGQRLFQQAVQLALVEHEAVIDGLVAGAAELDESSRTLARIGLAQYFAGAVVLPYTVFLQAARDMRYDIDVLAQRFEVGFETVCHRLSTLQRPGATGIPFLFLRTDRAGNISKRQSATAFHFSRFGGSCPLWVVHSAFESPNTVVRQIAEMPDGRRYLWIARTVSGRSRGFNRVVPEFSVGLGCAIEHATEMVYSAGLDLADRGAATPIGAGCRVCERPSCPQRAFPRAGSEVPVNLDLQSSSPYAADGPLRGR